MEETNKILKLITYKLCKIELKIIRKEVTTETQTGFELYPFINYSFIRLNTLEIESIIPILIKRKYKTEFILLEVLLHEICHFKQWKKFRKKTKFFKALRWFKYNKHNKDYIEAVADRYAHFVLKIILKEAGLWKNTLNIN